MADDCVAIGSDTLSARINPHGAELWSLIDTQGRQYMTDADPAFWSGHAPILFPVVGSLAGDRLLVDGVAYPLARHGFARRSGFDVVEHAADQVHFRLVDSPATRAVYPFAFALDLQFRLEGWRLDITASVTNPGAVPLPFSFGYHPAFAWPLPGGADKAAHLLTFAEPEPGAVRRVAPGTGLLMPDLEDSPVVGRDLALDAALFRADALIWTVMACRAGPASIWPFPTCRCWGCGKCPVRIISASNRGRAMPIRRGLMANSSASRALSSCRRARYDHFVFQLR